MTITIEFIIELLLLGAAIAIAAYILPFVYVRNYSSAVVVGVLIAIINGATVWLLGQLGIGVNAASMTLAGLVLNIFSIMAVDKLLTGFRVRHFWGSSHFRHPGHFYQFWFKWCIG